MIVLITHSFNGKNPQSNQMYDSMVVSAFLGQKIRDNLKIWDFTATLSIKKYKKFKEKNQSH